ncbi:hemolysin-type calcium binding protein [Plesiocystis pacifica SIR-1]|uniref:Hemolysin-type calcium binding protein n=1 Tax=Plesiocystis pacifica SIR-1 TaxID=391625 RepID=A6GH75_9BACT|nr:hypothetical protein [Plesiocystis pacifica]EDM74797.1 hemolysin-type calcium binding protein [Plesiocystis pacifica SIR-1]
MRNAVFALAALSLVFVACDEGEVDDEMLAEGDTGDDDGEPGDSAGCLDKEQDPEDEETGTDTEAQDEETEADTEAQDEETETETGDPGLEGQPCNTSSEWYECMGSEGEGYHFCDGGTLGPCVESPQCFPGDSKDCGLGEEFGEGWNMGCILVGGEPMWDWEACNTPLALSFDGGPIEMVTSAASFDISGTGSCLGSDWPSADNPWLAIDLDGSGSIEAGSELFGSGSILASGRHAQNGFLALSEYDSDGDGSITPADARFADILVWRDLDSDKRSLPSELSTLANEGVSAISLANEVRETCDARGNCGRERSAFEFQGVGGRVQTGEVVDIYLACD